MAAEILDISLRADIAHLKASLASMEGIGKKEASAMVGAMTREYRKAEKAAKKLGKTTGTEVSKGMEQAKGATERAASLMGGAFGDISDSVFDLGERIGSMAANIGGLGGLAVGAAGGVTALAFAATFAGRATLEWMEGATDLREQLESVAGLPSLDVGQIAALDAFAEATRDADAASAAASLTLMSQLAPAMTEIQHTTIGATTTFSHFLGGLDEVRHGGGILQAMLDTLDKGLGRVTSVISLGLVPAVQWFTEVGAEAAAQIREVKEETLEWEDAIKQSSDDIAQMAALLGYDTTPAVIDLDKRTRDAAAAARDHARALQEEWRAANDYQKGINAATAQLDEMVKAEKEAAKVQVERTKAFDESLASINEGWGDLDANVSEAIETIETKMIAHYAQMGMASTAAIASTIEAFADAELEALERQVQERKKLFSAAKSEREEERKKVEAQLESGELTEEQAEFRLAAIRAENQAARKERAKTRKEEEEAILKAFQAKQTMQVADATMQAAQNTLALVPAFAYLGPGAPAAAAAVSLALLATQLKTINNASPPEFPMGGMVRSPDHFPIGVQPGEGILSRSGVEAVGGPEGVDLLNRNSAGMSGDTVILQVDGRTAGALVMSASRSGPLARDADRRAGTLPGIKGVR